MKGPLPVRLRLEADHIVHGGLQVLFAAEVSLGRLDGHVPEQKLNLLECAAGEVSQAGIRAPQVVRRERRQTRASGPGGPHPRSLSASCLPPTRHRCG